jgi:hypothetical protein
LLEEVGPEEKRQNAVVDSTKDIAFFFVRERVVAAVGLEKFGCLVS